MNYFIHALNCITRVSPIIITELKNKYKLTKIEVRQDLENNDVVLICVCCGDKKWDKIKKQFDAFIW